ncbi:hypothetical protein IL306_009371, partial [Fusarium sp. DS 682]
MRPAMFVPVGPPGYTTVAFIGLARAIPEHGYFEKHPLAPEVLRILALWIGIWLWCLTFWFFSLAVISVMSSAIHVTNEGVHQAAVFLLDATRYLGVEPQNAIRPKSEG